MTTIDRDGMKALAAAARAFEKAIRKGYVTLEDDGWAPLFDECGLAPHPSVDFTSDQVPLWI